MDRKRPRPAEEAYSPDTNKLSKSCDLCKLKKVKCDGLKPLCSFCVKNDMDSCNYSVMKKPGLKPGYGKTMVQRLDNLEDEVISLKDQLRMMSQQQQYQHEPFPVQQLKSGGAINEDPSPSISSSSVANKSSLQIPTLLNPSPKSRPKLNVNGPAQLPSPSQILLLIDLFFLKISPLFPLLHPSIIPDLEKSIKTNSAMGLDPPLIVYAIILITLKFLNSDQMSNAEKVTYYNNCKERIISTSLKKINIESLQCLILLAYDSLGNSVKVPESWNYVSIAADYATYLKLGDEKSIRLSIYSGDSPSSVNSSIHSNDSIAKRKSKSISNRSLNLLRRPKTWIDEESRRHCFWCIYILDKLYAVSSSHEMKLKSNKINCLLPLKLKLWFDVNKQTAAHYTGQQLRTLRSNNLESPGNNSAMNSSLPAANNLRRDSTTDNTSPLSTANDDNYDSFAFYIELNKLVGDIHTFLIEEFNINDSYDVGNWKMKFKTLENQLFFWINTLPPKYRSFLETGELLDHTHDLEVYDILFFVYYYTTLIKLHSAAGFPHGESEYFKASEDSRKFCLDSAKKVFHFVSQLPTVTNDDAIFEKLGPLFGFYIWINSRILFVNVVYQSTQQIRNNSMSLNLQSYQTMLVFFADILLKIGKIWESSMVYYRILQFLNVSDLSYVTHNAISGAPLKNRGVGNSNNQEEKFGTLGAGSTSGIGSNGPAGELEDSEENSDDEVTGENREPASVFSDMRIGSHSLLYWFNKLAGNPMNGNMNLRENLDQSNLQINSLFMNAANPGSANPDLAGFQTSSAQHFDEFQLTHDEFFNFLALDINGSGSFQDIR